MKKIKIKVLRDEFAENPIGFYDDIKMNIINPPRGYYNHTAEIDETEKNNYYIFNIYVMNHSNIYFSLNDFKDCWDSWHVGYIGIKKDYINNEDKAIKAINQFLNEYNAYLNGDVYIINEIECNLCACCNHIIDEKIIDSILIYGYDELINYINENYKNNEVEYFK